MSNHNGTSHSALRRRVAIVGGNRIPFARSNKQYAQASNQDMLTATIDGLVARYGLQDERLGLVACGAVLKHARDFNLTRECVMGSALSSATPAIDLQQACGTSLAAAITVADAIAAGRIESGIAGGTDTASDVPLAISDELRRTLLKLNRAKSFAQRAAVAGDLVGNLRPGQLAPEQPRNSEPRTGLSMGEHAAQTAREWKISRQAQDELALASHQNLAAAFDSGFFNDLLTPYLGVTEDTNLRRDASAESLASLRPVFGKADAAAHDTEATMTAGNSTPLTDGAAVTLLASEAYAQEHNLEALAYLVDSETAAVDFVHGGEGLLMAPVQAVPRLLERNGLQLDDFDFFEIHEAFASQVLATLAAWEDEEYCINHLGLPGALGTIDRSKLNVKGSSLAAGHPFAATGARILATAAKTLKENGGGRALISICAAGGQGVTAIIER